jgi:hypothetical protein
LLQSTNLFVFIIFGLGPKLEIDYVFQPLAPPCPPNMAWKDKKWMKVGLKWKYKIGTYIVTHFTKWLLTKNLKEVHGLMAKKAKPKRPSISKIGP